MTRVVRAVMTLALGAAAGFAGVGAAVSDAPDASDGVTVTVQITPVPDVSVTPTPTPTPTPTGHLSTTGSGGADWLVAAGGAAVVVGAAVWLRRRGTEGSRG